MFEFLSHLCCAALFLLLISPSSFSTADTLHIDCKAVQAPYTTSNVSLRLGDSVTLAVWEGTSFYIDCFNFAIRSSHCDGKLNGGVSAIAKASIRSESVASSPSTVSSSVALSKDLFGTSLLSTAYYYTEQRRIYLVLDLLSIPPGCADDVNVLYTFSAYTSTSSPPLYSGSGWASPSLIGANDPLIIAKYNATLFFQLPTRTSNEGVVTTPPPTHQFGLLSVPSRTRSCNELNRVSGFTTYVSNPRLGPLLQWNISDAFSGVYVVCLRPNATTPFLYFGVITIFPTNPAYFHVDEFSIGKPIQLRQPYILTFVGKHLDLRTGKDSAKLASLISFSCATANPAGGVPPATALKPLNARDTPEAYWNITLTIPGAFYVCYYHASQWTAVPYYEPLGVDSRSLVPNTQGAISIGPIRFSTQTASRSLPPNTDSPITEAPSNISSTTTTAAPPQSTTTTTTEAPPQSTTPSPTTSSSSSSASSSDSSGGCVQLPQQCALLDDTSNTLRLVLSLAYTAAAFPSVSWSRNLSNVLCVPLKSVSIYELSNNESNPGYSSLVLGINCDGNVIACNAAISLSALHCLVNGGGAAANNSLITNETYDDWRMELRSFPLSIVSSRATSSSISTANTTNHAASSENPLTPTEVALVSSAIPVAIGIAGSVFSLLVLYRKRKFVRKQLGRLRPGEVFRQMFPRPVGQTADTDMKVIETYATGLHMMDVPLLNSLTQRSESTGPAGNVWGGAAQNGGSTSTGSGTPEHDELLLDVFRLSDNNNLAATEPPLDPLRAVLAGSRGRSSRLTAGGVSVHEVV